MADISKSIEEYIKTTIALDQKDISSAVKSREWLLAQIQSTIESRSLEPELYSSQRFVYFGSYIKGTKVDNVDEFDVLVVIDSNTGVYSAGGIQIGTGIGSANPNYKYDSKYRKSDDTGVSPRKLFNWLHDVVKESVEPYGGTAPEKSGGQAIVATIDSKDLKIDLVPAGVFKRDSDGTVFYNIPNGKSNNSWLITSPKADIKRLQDTASNRDNFRNVVRVCKRVKDTYGFTVSSFAIETAVINFALTNTWCNNLYDDVYGALNYLASAFEQGTISDPYSSDSNLVDGVVSLDWYSKRLTDICDSLSTLCNIENQSEANGKVVKLLENS